MFCHGKALGPEDVTVVIERFIGAGPRTSQSNETIKRIGFVQGYCDMYSLKLVQQVPQQRYPGLIDAVSVVGKKTHSADALAHIFAYCKKKGIGYGEIGA